MPRSFPSDRPARSPRRGTAALSTAAVAFLWLAACEAPPPSVEEAAEPASEQPAETSGRAAGTPDGGLVDWIDDIRATLVELPTDSPMVARQQVLDVYIGRQEFIELYYGPGGRLAPRAELVATVEEAEARFHTLMQRLGEDPPPQPTEVDSLVNELDAQLDAVIAAAEVDGVPPAPPEAALPGDENTAATVASSAGSGAEPRSGAPVATSQARTPEIRAILARLDDAEAAIAAGRRDDALRAVESAYLDGFEPLESLLPADRVHVIERLFHLSLRPALAGGGAADPSTILTDLRGELLVADGRLADGSGKAFAAFNAFAIIFREGLEAVLLVAAILAYLKASGADPRHHRHVLYGVIAAIAASLGTWALARTLIPIGGAQRELIEGVTALLAVGVLVYVSHWLFHKTYVQDWMAYLKRKVGGAVSAGSAFAMVMLAFAAVYREGFETVLFYQALGSEAGGGAVMAGFVPGALLIIGIAWAIIRLGLRLPMKTVFGLTNAVLLYLAFVFLGKGMYSLQEAGVFAPTPLGGLPSNRGLELLFGYHPMAETLLPQAAFLTLLAATWVWYRMRLRRAGMASGSTGTPA
jgi:FTR1 family protein